MEKSLTQGPACSGPQGSSGQACFSLHCQAQVTLRPLRVLRPLHLCSRVPAGPLRAARHRCLPRGKEATPSLLPPGDLVSARAKVPLVVVSVRKLSFPCLPAIASFVCSPNILLSDMDPKACWEPASSVTPLTFLRKTKRSWPCLLMESQGTR